MLKGKKLLVLILIFVLTFSYFAEVTEVVAAEGFMSLFSIGNNVKNVEFSATICDENGNSEKFESDINNTNLLLKINLGVKNCGYLKNANIEIVSNEKLNFKISKEKNLAEEYDFIQEVNNNSIALNKIDFASEDFVVEIPIEYVNEEFVNLNKLSSEFEVILSGIYVDDEGKENEFSKNNPLSLSWIDQTRELKIENEISKFIKYTDNGVILQTVLKVKNLVEENKNTLPIKESNVRINVPAINEVYPANVYVTANSTMGTNGKSLGETEFANENWSYNSEEKSININVANNAQNVEVVQDDYSSVDEERYYSKSGIDEYIITYVFKNVEIQDKTNISTTVEADSNIFNGVESKLNQIFASQQFDYEIDSQTGEIVSLDIENTVPSVSKIYGYLNNGTEVEYGDKVSINVSYTDLVNEIIVEDTDNYYLSKLNEKIQTSDICYKKLNISKDNFDEILGEDGYINVNDENGNLLYTINKDSQLSESNNYEYSFENKLSKISLTVSKPISVGNLIINEEKYVSNVSLSKNEYKNISSINTVKSEKVKFDYLEDIVEIDTKEVVTELLDTKTFANIVVDRNNLSTVAQNNGVQFNVELNNDKLTSDMYGNSVIDIELPEEVTNVEVTDYKIVYGEGLEISSVENYGKNCIRVKINGKQASVNSGILTNGTNIIIDTNIDVYKYLPTLNRNVKLYVYNEEATNNENEVQHNFENVRNCTYNETDIELTASKGVINATSISNYNSENSSIESVKEGIKTEKLEIHSTEKRATMNIVVINNNEDTISNVSILGRFPADETYNIDSDDKLESNINVKLNSLINTNNNNVTVYYSENGNATKDLEESSNNWTTQPENTDNVKSYLIVFNDKVDAKQVMKFDYEFTIPENLGYNNTIDATFATYYKNDSTNVEEKTSPDKVLLTTGIGPELNLDMTSSKNELNSYEEFNVDVKFSNTGKEIANNVKIELNYSSNITYISAESNRENTVVNCENNIVTISSDKMAVGSSCDVTLKFMANLLTDDSENLNVEISARLISDEFEKEVTAQLNNVTIKKSDMAITSILDREGNINKYFQKGEKFDLIVKAQNLTSYDKTNVVAKTVIPQEIKIIDAYIQLNKEEKRENVSISDNVITWKIDKLEQYKTGILMVEIEIGDLDEGILGKSVEITGSVTADNTELYNGANLVMNIGKSKLSIEQTTNTNTYVSSGDIIEYNFKIKNEGKIDAQNITLTDTIPDGLIIRKMTYIVDGIESVNKFSATSIAQIDVTIPAESEVNVNVQAIATNLGTTEETTVTNTGKIETDKQDVLESNSITHIIKNTDLESDDSNNDDNEEQISGIETQESDKKDSQITKSSKISGKVWVDANKNGMREDTEEVLSDVTVLLVNNNSGAIQKMTLTNSNGEYTFAGLENGNYIVLFKYNTKIYTTTSYKKQDIDSSINSDAFATQIEQDGKKENAAVTDSITVNGVNVLNIDVGLVKTSQFSLKLDNAITKITVQNRNGTNTDKYDGTKLAKAEIASKYISGSTVYVEYTITVTNNGDLTGFASEIVDYIPNGMTFNSNLNPDWYTGTDGLLYTKALANKELAKDESTQITLVLTKQMTTENTGLVSNTVEISSDYNIYGVSDYNSTPGNKAQNEDDISTADAILTVKTGGVVIYTSGVIVCVILGLAGGMIFIKKRKNASMKEENN